MKKENSFPIAEKKEFNAWPNDKNSRLRVRREIANGGK